MNFDLIRNIDDANKFIYSINYVIKLKYNFNIWDNLYYNIEHWDNLYKKCTKNINKLSFKIIKINLSLYKYNDILYNNYPLNLKYLTINIVHSYIPPNILYLACNDCDLSNLPRSLKYIKLYNYIKYKNIYEFFDTSLTTKDNYYTSVPFTAFFAKTCNVNLYKILFNVLKSI